MLPCSPLPHRTLSHKSFLLVAVCLLLFACAPTGAARAGQGPAQSDRRLVIYVSGGATREGSRLTVTADSPVEGYRSYVEGERVFVLVAGAKLAGSKGDARGRGFDGLRVEQTGADVLLSFTLRPGATVQVNQNFNRLDINFFANEQVSANQNPKR